MALDKISERVYREQLLEWLPPRIVDVHAHAGLSQHMGPVAPERMAAMWAIEVATDQSWEVLRDTYRLLFPQQKVSALVFGFVFKETDIDANNDYVLQGVLDPRNESVGLCVTRPEWDAAQVEAALTGGFAGIKPYPDLAPADDGEVSIYDFLPAAHLEVLNERGGVLMLHLPRRGRLADENNIRELLEISERYPRVRVIVAHIGRSFCLPTAERGLPHFTDVSNIWFDTSANLNSDVFAFALDTIGADRILFGSDLPITLMRGVREHVGEQYINYTDGPYSWNTNRKPPEEEANYTFFLYEELLALIAAIERCGMGRREFDAVMYSNAARLLGLMETRPARPAGGEAQR